MDQSIFLARVIGICFTVFGLGLVLNRASCRALLQNISENPALVLFVGGLNLVLGALIVVSHPIWEWNWTLLITVTGWLLLIRGIFWLIFPRKLSGFVLKASETNKPCLIGGSIGFILGIILLCLGFC